MRLLRLCRAIKISTANVRKREREGERLGHGRGGREREGERVREAAVAVMQPRQVQWPPNCAGKCHTRGNRTCQSTPVPDGRERERVREGKCECDGEIGGWGNAPSSCTALCL